MGDYVSSDDECYYPDIEDDCDCDDGGDVDGDSLPNSSPPSSKVITGKSLWAAQMKDLRTVMDCLSLKEHHARTLLIHHRWDVVKVLDLFVEKGVDKLYAEAGVTMMKDGEQFSSQLSSTVTCNVCFGDVSANDVTTMDCGHYFCNSCWSEHFIVKINEGQSRCIRCMAHKCNAICDDAKVKHLVSARDYGLAEKFHRFLLESYIEDNRRVKWCPSVPHCGNAIQIEDDELCEVECACGVQFCFRCSSEAHSPCSCRMWELWFKKCRDGSETVNWMTVHTKPCPKCEKPVEKNGGCNLVFCVCEQAFCWLCGGATGRDHTFTSITGHSCGRYNEVQEKKAADAKRDLERYIHYHNRYKAHTDSLKLESKLKETIQVKISKLEEKKMASMDFSWVINGLCRLSRSRRVLSYSYPFAYYMFGDNLFKGKMTTEERQIKQNLFEDLQQQFEENVEKLSMLLEEQFDTYSEDKVTKLRMNVISLSVTTDKLGQNLFDYIETDLLGSLELSGHEIAPYKSKGVEKASELP